MSAFMLSSSHATSNRHIRLAKERTSYLVHGLIFFQLGCQILLIFTSLGTLRPLLRSASFGASLFLVGAVRRRGHERKHPAVPVASGILLIIFLSIFHPTTNTLLSAVAVAAMYVAILAPLFWVPRLNLNFAALRSIFMVIWLFYSLSASIGVLQVYFPGRFQPNLSTIVAAKDKGYVDSLHIVLADGQRVFRPMGLTDVPGGAAVAGFYAVLFGVGFFFAKGGAWIKTACMFTIIIGVTCIYLTQVRSTLITMVVCLCAFCCVMAMRLRLAKVWGFAAMMIVTLIVSFTFAVSLGGKGVTDRLDTLDLNNPGKTYYQYRGFFLEKTINELLPQYPLGAGLGRWGMMNSYFGENTDSASSAIWAEIQWTGWLLDGGILLILAYTTAIIIATLTAWRIALSSLIQVHPDALVWGSLIVSYNIGAFVLTFSYPLFGGQSGLEFWLINAVLFAAAQNSSSEVSSKDEW